jgi:hypothetical protein
MRSSQERPFEGCWQRIERANSHRIALGETWNDFIDDDPYTAVVIVEDDGTGGIWVRPNYDSLPPVFGLELGEVLYHLRAALDACIYQAAMLETGQDPPPNERDLQFPLCSSRESFERCIRNIAPLSPERRNMVERLQPYNTPEVAPQFLVCNFNRNLSIVNDWARKDRHRRLHVVGSWGSKANPKLRLSDGEVVATFTSITQSGFLEAESQVASFRIEGYTPEMKTKVQGNPDIMIDIAVDETPPPCADTDTLGNRLLAMVETTEAVVDWFERSFGISSGHSRVHIT